MATIPDYSDENTDGSQPGTPTAATQTATVPKEMSLFDFIKQN